MATVFTNVGQQALCDRVRDPDNEARPDYIDWGTGTTAANAADTTLETPGSESRVQGTVTTNGTGASAKYQVVGTMTADGTIAVTEMGLFNASTSGDMWIRSVFTAINLDTSDAIEFTVTLDPS